MEKDSVMLDLVKEWKLSLTGIEAMRMNIIAVSWRHKLLFVACSDRIKVFKLLENGELDPHSEKIEDIVIMEDKRINQIKVGMFRNEEVLVVVDMNSKMSIVTISQFPFSVETFDNNVQGEPDSSTWSVDTFCGTNSYIAAGSNARIIAIWDENLDRKVIEAHDHNIPCIKFSPCGKYIASTSIDKSVSNSRILRLRFKVRLFDVKTGKKVAYYTNLSSWGWCVEWILKDEVYGCQANNEKKGTLEDYLLFAADEKYIYLLNPHKDNSNKTMAIETDNKPYSMEVVSQFKFSQDVYYTYYLAVLHGRFALCYYIRNLSTLIIIPQHTPWVHFARIVYDQVEKRFTISSQQNIATANNSRILGIFLILDLYKLSGSWLLETPEDLEKKATLYLVTEKKEIVRIEINRSSCVKPLLEYTF